mmetsp:Transcript_116720/g.341711  ORF Transcript_116720/g.341711 Transcript_116720/m.341711 type:complete len:493 (-) Transcript_116720:47-1525(-)
MSRTAVFVFPSAAGHINPSLPLCKRLVNLGWHVKYLSIEAFKCAIEKTGATFHDRDAVCAEHGIPDVTAMFYKSLSEYGDPGAKMWALNFGSIATEKLLPVYIGFLRRHSPDLVVYCPVLCSVAHFAAMHLKIPDASLLTAAGPGFWDAAFASHGGSPAGLISTINANEANAKAIEGIRCLMNMPELTLNTSEPLVNEYYTSVNIVTTVASLADALNEKDAQFYDSVGKEFEFVGPLLGESQATVAAALSGEDTADLFERVEEATAAHRKVIYVSMGTVVTGDDPEHGWNGTSGSALTGKLLCRCVYRAVFAELGSGATAAGATPLLSPPPLVVVSLGPQLDALAGVSVPDNVICLKSVPQVGLLRLARPALVVTNGGQNSFVEAMSVGSPLVVCPGFGDQISNAATAQRLGLGVKVDRPALQTGSENDSVEVAAVYQAAVSDAVREVLAGSGQEFLAKAQAVAAELERGGGVDKAIQILLKVAGIQEPGMK